MPSRLMRQSSPLVDDPLPLPLPLPVGGVCGGFPGGVCGGFVFGGLCGFPGGLCVAGGASGAGGGVSELDWPGAGVGSGVGVVDGGAGAGLSFGGLVPAGVRPPGGDELAAGAGAVTTWRLVGGSPPS